MVSTVMFDVPEHAIHTFEAIHNLKVTIHDLRGSLWTYLEPDRFRHISPLCVAVKAAGGPACCLEFDMKQIRVEIPHAPDGQVKICHAGLVEWVYPAYRGLELEWVIFAGPRVASPSLKVDLRQKQSAWVSSPWSAETIMPKPVDENESALILEHLRQLTARLINWRESTEAMHANPFPAFEAAVPSANRTSVIRRFIASRHTDPLTLKDLADVLCLSESRTGHVVQSCCGMSFRSLLTEARLRTAMGLLRHSALSVAQVGAQCGFTDLVHFHRSFRRATGLSPGKFRGTVEP